MDPETVLQCWRMLVVIFLKRHDGLVRITEQELKDYNSDDGNRVAIKVLEDAKGIDAFFVTDEELARL